jgi:hypothetical protein
VFNHGTMRFQVHCHDDHRPVEEDRQTIHTLSQFLQVRYGQIGTVELDGNTIQTNMTTGNLRFQISREASHLHRVTSPRKRLRLPCLEVSRTIRPSLATDKLTSVLSWAKEIEANGGQCDNAVLVAGQAGKKVRSWISVDALMR